MHTNTDCPPTVKYFPCPHCGEPARYPYAVTFVGEFTCEHCGAYHPGDCGLVRPGYFMRDGNTITHYMTASQKKSLEASQRMWMPGRIILEPTRFQEVIKVSHDAAE